MEVDECIRTRRCIRKYLPKDVPWDLVSKVVDAGRMAPSAGNLQNWKFIVVQDPEKRQKIADACVQQQWMAAAPVHIVIVAEPKVTERYYGSRGERLYSIQNTAVAAENMLLMAHNLGLGAGWVGAFDERMLGKAVKLPDEVRPHVVITLGYPAEKPAEPAKYPIENVCYFERWRGKIKDAPAYMGDYSVVWVREGKKAKATLEKHAEKAVEKGKQVAEKIKKRLQESSKKRKDLKHFKKVHGLK